MANKINYDVELVIEAIDKYFYIEHFGNTKELVMTRIAKYLKENGFENINDRKLNRNALVTGHIEELKTKSKVESDEVTFNYTPLIVDDFIKTNNNIDELKKALTILDKYYERIYQYALGKVKEANDIDKISYDLNKKIRDLKNEVESNKNTVRQLKARNEELELVARKYRKYIKETMLPEIANEVLRQDDLLFDGSKMVTDNGYNEMLIDETKSIKSVFKDIHKKEKKFKNNLISGLIDSIEKDSDT